jgi:dolichyl-phosphate-mannose--protein O-mannosyl transferase
MAPIAISFARPRPESARRRFQEWTGEISKRAPEKDARLLPPLVVVVMVVMVVRMMRRQTHNDPVMMVMMMVVMMTELHRNLSDFVG